MQDAATFPWLRVPASLPTLRPLHTACKVSQNPILVNEILVYRCSLIAGLPRWLGVYTKVPSIQQAWEELAASSLGFLGPQASDIMSSVNGTVNHLPECLRSAELRPGTNQVLDVGSEEAPCSG